MSILGAIHISCAMLALLSGAVVVLLRKGTAPHRLLGYVYSVGMIGLIISALLIYNLFGTWGAFHWTTLVAIMTLIGGLAAVIRRRRRGWMIRHATWMSWSYIGLMAAFVAESLTRWIIPTVAPFMPALEEQQLFWPAVFFGSSLVIATGAWLVSHHLPQAVSSVKIDG